MSSFYRCIFGSHGLLAVYRYNKMNLQFTHLLFQGCKHEGWSLLLVPGSHCFVSGIWRSLYSCHQRNSRMEILLSKCFPVSCKVGTHFVATVQFMESMLFILFSVCPSIWLIELDKLDKRLEAKIAREAFLSSNITTLPPTTTEGEN